METVSFPPSTTTPLPEDDPEQGDAASVMFQKRRSRRRKEKEDGPVRRCPMTVDYVPDDDQVGPRFQKRSGGLTHSRLVFEIVTATTGKCAWFDGRITSFRYHGIATTIII